MFKRILAGVAALVASLALCTVAAQEAQACTNPTYGNVYCNPGAPAPPPARHRPLLHR